MSNAEHGLSHDYNTAIVPIRFHTEQMQSHRTLLCQAYWSQGGCERQTCSILKGGLGMSRESMKSPHASMMSSGGPLLTDIQCPPANGCKSNLQLHADHSLSESQKQLRYVPRAVEAHIVGAADYCSKPCTAL